MKKGLFALSAAVGAILWLGAGPAAAQAPREDCVGFNPARIEVKEVQGKWKIVEGTHWIMDFGNKAGEARQSFQIIKKYNFNRICFVGRPGPSMTYYLPAPRALPSAQPPLREDCVRFNPARVEAKQVQGRWKVVEGTHWILDFGDKAGEAGQALQVIKRYGFNHSCFVGRPQPSMTYYLAAVAPPRPPTPPRPPVVVLPPPRPAGPPRPPAPVAAVREDCVSFNPARIEAKEVQGRWKVVEGTHWILDFGNKAGEARQGLQIIRMHGFNRVCFVGRPDPSMTYFLRR